MSASASEGGHRRRVCHDRSLTGDAGQDVPKVGNGPLDLGWLVSDFLPLPGCEATQLPVEDGSRPDLEEVVTGVGRGDTGRATSQTMDLTSEADPCSSAARKTTADSPELLRLMRRSALGDEAAFSQLYRQTAARVYGLVYQVVRDPAQSEEVTQEVFVDIWRTASRFDATRGSALSWLMTIARRRAVDRVRTAESSRRRDSSYHHLNRPQLHDHTAEAVEASLEAERVRAAMDALTLLQRQALELAYFAGHTYTEVAAMLDLPASTVKARIRDGLIRLRETL